MKDEESRVDDTTFGAFLMSRPTTVNIMDEFNEFITSWGIDNPVNHLSQLTRITEDLKQAGLLFNPKRPEDLKMMGETHVLVPKLAAQSLYRELQTNCGLIPMRWPDLLPYDATTGRARWDLATFSAELAQTGS